MNEPLIINNADSNLTNNVIIEFSNSNSNYNNPHNLYSLPASINNIEPAPTIIIKTKSNKVCCSSCKCCFEGKCNTTFKEILLMIICLPCLCVAQDV